MTDGRIPEDLRRQPDSHDPDMVAGHVIDDPLRLCIATTVALIAWLVTPALAVTIFGTIAIVGYARARRAGLMSSRCKLGDTRIVLAYLTLATLAGAVATVMRFT